MKRKGRLKEQARRQWIGNTHADWRADGASVAKRMP